MKNRFHLFILALFSSIPGITQVPNGGFESWTLNDPDGWVTTNALMLLGNPQSVFQSTDAHSGSSACEIRTVQLTNKPPGIPLPDYIGSVFTGKQIFTTPVFGFPFTSKPKKLNFWYKFNAMNNDTATVLAYTTRWNTVTGKRDTLSYGYALMKDTISVYTQNEVLLMMLDSINAPDSAVVVFTASIFGAPHAGAKLTVDDVEFTGGNVGLTECEVSMDMSVYPNPMNQDYFYLQLNQPAASVTVTILNTQGQTVAQYNLSGKTNTHTLHTGTLPTGLYLIGVQTENAHDTRRLIVE